MNLKKFMLVVSIFLLCGCECTYNLSIKGSTYTESFTLHEEAIDNGDKTNLNASFLEEYPIFYSQEFPYNNPYEKLEGNTYYDKNLESVNDLLKANYTATFDNDSYKDSRALKTAFKNRNIGYDSLNKYYYLELSDLIIFNADNKINKINVNITVDDNFVVIGNNANSINDNTYSWTFDNVNGKILLKYQSKENYNKAENNKPQEDGKENFKPSDWLDENGDLIIAIALLATFLIVGLSAFYKARKSGGKS